MKIDWAVKLTPIDGVIELGVCEPNQREWIGIRLAPHIYHEHFTTIPEIEEYMLANGLHCNDRNHWANPQLANVDSPNRNPDDFGPNHWHTDTKSGCVIGTDMIVMLAGNVGTHFSGPIELHPYKTRFIALPWHVYMVHGDIIHRAPYNSDHEARIIYRWYQSDKTVDDNSRRDEDGNFVLADV